MSKLNEEREKNSTLESVKQGKQTSKKSAVMPGLAPRLRSAFIFFLLATAFIYAICGVVNLKRSVFSLREADANAEAFFKELEANVDIPLDLPNSGEERTEERSLRQTDGVFQVEYVDGE